MKYFGTFAPVIVFMLSAKLALAGGEGDNEFYSVSYNRLIRVLVEAIKELNGEVEQRDTHITELQARLSALETLVEQLALQTEGIAK